ncbi:MAG: hypothetical protein IID52_09260 [Proteobacteria bacterium]|nr:hypothetical protein [Pseudomonadota bacterium]
MKMKRTISIWVICFGIIFPRAYAIEIEDAVGSYLERINISPTPAFVSACSVKDDKWIKHAFLIYIFHENGAGVYSMTEDGITGYIAGIEYSSDYPNGKIVDIQGGLGSAILGEEIIDFLNSLLFVRLEKPTKEEIIAIAKKTKCNINHDKIEEYYKSFEK